MLKIGYQCGGWMIAWHKKSGKMTLGKNKLSFAKINVFSIISSRDCFIQSFFCFFFLGIAGIIFSQSIIAPILCNMLIIEICGCI